MKLCIDTSKIRSVTITLGKFQKTGQEPLPIIDELKLSDVTEIEVVTGPGSFTGLRVGAAVANTLGLLLDIPVNGKKDLVIPTY